MRLHCGSATISLDTNQVVPSRGGVLLGLGSAPGYLDPAQRFHFANPGIRIMAVNDCIGQLRGDDARPERVPWPYRLDFAGSLHEAMLSSWLEARRDAGLVMPCRVFGFARKHAAVTARFFESSFPIGSSGFLCVVVGRMLLDADVVLAGVRLDGGYSRYRRCWREAKALGLLDRVYTLDPGPLVQDGLVPLISADTQWKEAA